MTYNNNRDLAFLLVLVVFAILLGLTLKLPVNGIWLLFFFNIIGIIWKSLPFIDAYVQKRKREQRILKGLEIGNSIKRNQIGNTTYHGKAL